MADDRKWFKVWTKILSDPDFEIMSLQDWGRWVKLLALVALHGTNGSISVEPEYLMKHLEMTQIDALQIKNIRVENRNGKVTVTLKNWKIYQAKSESYERVTRWREKQKETQPVTVTDVTRPLPDKNRIDKIRIDKIRIEKKTYGANQNILLTEKEYQDLLTAFPEKAIEFIDHLSYQIASTGKKYKSHYMTILNHERRGYFQNSRKDW